MNGPLRVATPCPSCGAAVDFEEGSQTFRCGYCGSDLWITGYRRTLTYAIPPKVIPQAATIAALREIPSRLPQFSLKEITLGFLPYYRYTGAACWLEEEKAEKLPEEFEGDLDERLTRGAELGFLSNQEETRWVLKSRSVEKNFIATDLPIAGLYSLGLRASVLPLSIFQPESLMKTGVLFPVHRSEEEAIEVGAKEGISDRGYQPVGGRLAAIYFPFYLARCEREGERGALVVDGVTGDVIASERKGIDLPPSKPPDSFATIRFRPLKCPDCGWGLPPRPRDVILACSTCGRAWRTEGENFIEIPTEYGAPPAGAPKDKFRYLPFWSMSVESKEALPGLSSGALLRIPAFGCRNLKTIHPITLGLLARQVRPPSVPFESGPPLEGCFYDGEEARRMGRNFLILFLIQKAYPIDRAEKIQIDLGEPRLVWIPFLIRGIEYIEPNTRLGFLRSLVF